MIASVLAFSGCGRQEAAPAEPEAPPAEVSQVPDEAQTPDGTQAPDGTQVPEDPQGAQHVEERPEPYNAGDLFSTFEWCGRPVDSLGVHHSYIDDLGIEVVGTVFGAEAEGHADKWGIWPNVNNIGSIHIYLNNADLPAEECQEKLKEMYGEPIESGEDAFQQSNEGIVHWEIYDAGNGSLQFSKASKDDRYSLYYALKADAVLESEYLTGDFDLTDPLANEISWDADGDGTEENVLFEYNDQGDEAPSFIAVTLYKEDSETESIIDRAYALKRIFAKEDDDGPYLQIFYESGDYYSHDAEAECSLRLEGDELVIEEVSQ